VTELSRAAVWSEFLAITADYTLTDDESAFAYGAIAQETADPTLAAAVQRVADGFARGDPAVSSAEVRALCEADSTMKGFASE
jgi:hypothetical protein